MSNQGHLRIDRSLPRLTRHLSYLKDKPSPIPNENPVLFTTWDTTRIQTSRVQPYHSWSFFDPFGISLIRSKPIKSCIGEWGSRIGPIWTEPIKSCMGWKPGQSRSYNTLTCFEKSTNSKIAAILLICIIDQ